MSNQLALAAQGVQLASLADYMAFANIVVNSGLAPSGFKSADAVILAMQHGAELGIPPAQALQSIAVINGRCCVYGDLALALVLNHPTVASVQEDVKKGETDDEKYAFCTITLKSGQEITRRFSVEDAKRAGLWDKAGPWKQYPKRMLQMRARSWAMRDACPQALKGVQVREELEDAPATRPANIREVPVETLRFAGEPEPAPQLADKVPEPTHEPSDNDLANEDLFK